MKRIIAYLMVLLGIMTGCVSATGPKEQAGTLLGAGTGALVGSQIGHGRGTLVAVAIGSLAGALIGQGTGQSLDRADQLAMEANARYTLAQGRPNLATTWNNPDTGSSGALIPVRTFATSDGRFCREYIQTVIIGGVEQQGYGTACRQPDGSWLIVANNDPVDYQQRGGTYDASYQSYYPRGYYPYYYPSRLFFSFGYFHYGRHLHHGKHRLHDGHHLRGKHHLQGGHHFKGGHRFDGRQHFKGRHHFQGDRHFRGDHRFKGGHHFKGGHGLRGGGHHQPSGKVFVPGSGFGMGNRGGFRGHR